ncbi:septum formation protein Maf [Flaviaesturariibacter flavus]|uniref:dTTP/UTP pyrophosphatase n=1 Tax=Flaviaesturariibacter flavus TaxID=2502780 RepID=A0A4R1BNQ1_9BACT|nr:Maf family nucleotide pyrophosphatase [Flaviaesturariibacter flavus]TCJ19179.1 septum formation protein Maf [Flaviaesturariibacter flavus]
MASYILASQSPRRKQLLEWAEIDFDIRIANTDESYPEGLTPEAVAEHIAREKAAVVARAEPGRTIIAADTIVVLGAEIIGKPADRDDAVATLRKLSGNAHRVITGVAIRRGDREVIFHDVTEVQFHPLSEEQLTFYVDKYRPYDKAGAYAIQEWIGVVGIKAVQGDFYNVMGLPVSRVVQALRDF